ncbi:hypothetical protein Tco_1014675 [Tanacetum coccineum]
MDFEDLFLSIFKESQPSAKTDNKTSLHTESNMWIRKPGNPGSCGGLAARDWTVFNTKVNLERPNWGCSPIVLQRRLYDLNGTVTRELMEKLDHMVKDFHLFEYNKGMESRKWSEDDKRRSKDFITAIEKRLRSEGFSNENLKLTVDEPVIPEEPASSTGTLSSLQHLAKDFSFGDQFFNDKPSEADNEKTTADT